jgi:hypothetical protein
LLQRLLWLIEKFGGAADGGADSCHNIDRICREPFSWNNPDEKKVAEGRTRVRGHVLEQEKRHRYASSAFHEALKSPLKRKQKAASERGNVVVNVQAGDEVKQIVDVSELDRWKVPDRVKVILVQGKHPDEPKNGDDSRSAWVFDACCSLVRCGVDDEIIYSVLLNKSFGISESVLEKAGNAESYAIRQIERAKEQAIDANLARMNAVFFVVRDLGGKPAVCCWKTFDDIERLTTRTFEAFEQSYRNEWVEGENAAGNTTRVRLGKWWLDHPRRRTYENLVLDPTKPETFDSNYNLWRGYGVKPKQGDWSLMKRHIEDVLADGNKTNAEYIIRWSAWVLQNPGERAEVALTFRGGEGVGKGIFGRALKALFGRNGKQIFSSKHLVGRFNAHLRDACFVFADEAVAPDDKDGHAALKGLITEPELPIEGKGRDVDWAANHVSLIIVGNEDHLVPAGKDARRYMVLNVPPTKQQNEEWFNPIVEQLKNGGLEAMLHDLLAMDLGKWHPRKRVVTEALHEQQRLGLKGAERLMLEFLELGDFQPVRLEAAKASREQGYIMTSDLVVYAQEWFGEKVTPKAFANVCKRVGFAHDDEYTRHSRYRPPALADARELFSRLIVPCKFEGNGNWKGIGGQPAHANTDVHMKLV